MKLDKGPPCIVCRKELENYDPPPKGNQPICGTEFTAGGHYGSTVTDTMDCIAFAVNICDECIVKAGKDGLVLRVYPAEVQPRSRPIYKRWDGK